MKNSKLSTSAILISVLFTMAIVSVNAHITFIETDDKPKIIPTTQGVTIFFGHTHTPQTCTTEFPHGNAKLYKPDGTFEDLKLKKEANYWTSNITLDQMGDYIVTVAREPHIYDPKWHQLAGSVRLSQGFAKALTRGGGPEGWNKTVGQGLEIVPLVNPFYLQVGDEFKARLFHMGTPIKGEYAAAHESQNIHDPETAQIGETMENGTFSVTITKPGMWLIVANTYLEESGVWTATYSVDTPPVVWTEGEDYEYDELWFSATLTIWAEPGVSTLAHLEDRISLLEEEVANIPLGPSVTLVYSTLGISLASIGIAITVLWKSRK